jgi:hypothetical protein
LRAKGVVIVDTGHHLTSLPTDFKVKIQTGKKYSYKKCVSVYTCIYTVNVLKIIQSLLGNNCLSLISNASDSNTVMSQSFHRIEEIKVLFPVNIHRTLHKCRTHFVS